ncbi:MAG: ATP phosphoribosyltransferase, partial [Lentisphaeria bacterium]|nr:ATP phosphoribosyltransferase [Lentisphaeria bacterium]
MNDFSGNLKLAVPNKGALSEGAVSLLQRAGYRCSRSGRELVVSDTENNIDFVFLRPRDIALYVGNGIIDLGITGIDLAGDSGADVEVLFKLGFGKSRYCFATPKVKKMTVDQLNGLRIATSYPDLLRAELKKRNMECKIVKLDGAVEISIALGVADAIADVVESGATLREAGLEII